MDWTTGTGEEVTREFKVGFASGVARATLEVNRVFSVKASWRDKAKHFQVWLNAFMQELERDEALEEEIETETVESIAGEEGL